MKHGNIVMAKPKVAEAGSQRSRIHKQVGYDHHERPLTDRLGEFVEHFRQPRFALGLGFLQDVKHHSQMRRTASRREAPHDPVGHARDADGIALLSSKVAQRAAETPGILNFCQACRAKVHRTAGVENKATSQIGVGLEFLDVVAIGPSECPPIEPPQIVAGNILSVLRKFDARPTMWTRMPSRHASDHRLPRQQGNCCQAREHLRLKKTARLAVREHWIGWQSQSDRVGVQSRGAWQDPKHS